MNCSSSEERLARFVDGELNPRERAELAAHLDRCSSCTALLEELRAVDALFVTARPMDPGENFTHATMAGISALGVPCARRFPLAAYLICYLLAAWLLIGAAFLLAPQHLYAAARATLDAVRTILDALGGVAHVILRVSRSDPGALVASIVAADLVCMFALIAVARAARPAIAERLRS